MRDQVIPRVPVRQWVLSSPFPLRFLMASNPQVLAKILGITLRCLTGWIRRKVKVSGGGGCIKPGAVTFIQRFGGSLNLNVHFHRPALATRRLTRRFDGMLVYELKQAYRDGTKYLLFSPEELLEKLAALVPRPWVHLIRYHGCLAPNAKIRAEVVSQARGPEGEETGEKPEESRGNGRRMNWAQLLKRVFKVDVEACPDCGGKLRVLAAVLEPGAIGKILRHLGLSTDVPKIYPARAPPQGKFEF